MELCVISLVMFSPSCGYSMCLTICYHIFTLYNSYSYDYEKIIQSTIGCSEMRLSLSSFMSWFISEL